MIKVEHVNKSYKTSDVSVHALKDVNLTIEQGEIVVLLGPSGSGKSTLLNVLSGLDEVTSGVIKIHDQEITALKEHDKTLFRRKHLGFVFQQYNLLPSLSIKENIEIGAKLSIDAYNIDEIAAFVSIQDQLHKYPHQLSGGEQQRTSIARAVIKKPDILFCDEPTGALDDETSKDVLALIQKLNEEYNTTVILITHNPNISVIADRVITLHSGEIHDVRKQTRKKASEIIWR